APLIQILRLIEWESARQSMQRASSRAGKLSQSPGAAWKIEFFADVPGGFNTPQKPVRCRLFSQFGSPLGNCGDVKASFRNAGRRELTHAAYFNPRPLRSDNLRLSDFWLT